MKLNWGSGIAAVYISFMVGVLIMVYIFMNQDVTLETEDYYAKGINYQEQIDKIKRTSELPEQLLIQQEGVNINFYFPKIFSQTEIDGTIFFYRPSDDKQDFTKEIQLNTEMRQSFSVLEIEKGLWKIKVDWLAKNNSYYNEKLIMVN
jgi:hypothetical protein